jgi:hypothetical protein
MFIANELPGVHSTRYLTFGIDKLVCFQCDCGGEGDWVASKLKACFDIGLKWLFTRLLRPSAPHTIKEYTEEEVVRYVDNVIRTVISLMESEIH